MRQQVEALNEVSKLFPKYLSLWDAKIKSRYMTAGNERSKKDMKVVVLGMIRFLIDMMVLIRRAHSFPTARRVAGLRSPTGKSKAAAVYHRKDRLTQRHLVIRGIRHLLDTIKLTIKVKKKCTQIGTAIPNSTRRDGLLRMPARARQLRYSCKT
jgi:hypothetical protein